MPPEKLNNRGILLVYREDRTSIKPPVSQRVDWEQMG